MILATVLLALLTATPLPPNPATILEVSTDIGTAHACQVSETIALTAAHVSKGGEVRFALKSGDHGELSFMDDGTPSTDVAAMRRVTGKFEWFFRIAKTGPQPGDLLYLVGFKLDPKHYEEPRLITTHLIGETAGMLVFDEVGLPGSSGSCVFNVAGEVVAINKGGNDTTEPGKMVGRAVSIYGDWLPTALLELISQ